jgi:4-hydroxymandelate oxidase
MANMSSWIRGLELASDSLLPSHVREYFSATASEAEVAAAALAEWDAVRYRPRAFLADRSLDLATTVLGTPVASPILVAPMAQQVAADPAGERAVADAVVGLGTLLAVSTNNAIPFPVIRDAGAPWWFQVYLLPDRGLTRLLVERAVAAGARALVFTVDTTKLLLTDPGVDPEFWPAGPERARLSNLTDEERSRLSGASNDYAPPSLGDIAWLREISGGLPIVVKGILRADDAVAAVEAGASAVLVSTHGGRRIGASITSLAALPEVVAAVGDRVEVYLDSGIRSGAHVFTALALGARAVFVGRPVMWGLATGGTAGVRTVLERLTGELLLTLDQSGAAGIHALTPDLVVV